LNQHQADVHAQYVTIEEDIEFPEVLSAKQRPEKARKMNT
jgi:hypothetical protein